MSGPLMYLVAFRSGKWSDGPRTNKYTLDQNISVQRPGGYICLANTSVYQEGKYISFLEGS